MQERIWEDQCDEKQKVEVDAQTVRRIRGADFAVAICRSDRGAVQYVRYVRTMEEEEGEEACTIS